MARQIEDQALRDGSLRAAPSDDGVGALAFQRPIAFARIASGIFSTSGTLNTPEATRTISPPQTRSQLQKQKLMVRRAMRAVPSSHWPSLRAAHELGAERHRRMRPADAGGMARAHAHHHVGHGHQQAAMRPAHGIAVARLERQADPELLALDLEPERADQPDEVSGTSSLRKPSGISVSVMSQVRPWKRRISRARRAPRARTACCDASPRSATP